MAAYAALVSLTNLIDQSNLYHAHHPIFLDEQLLQLQSLQEKLIFLQDFLESYPLTEQIEDLERRIPGACYRAEDIIESHVADDIDAQRFKTKSHSPFSHMPRIIRFMDSIKKEMVKITETSRLLEDHLVPVGSIRPLPTHKDDKMMVFDDELNKIMGKLIGQGSNLQIIPIAGMGGIGKTTLAKNTFDNPYIFEYFDIRGWITISQAYILREVLLDLALGIGVHLAKSEKENSEYHVLVEKIYKHLSGRRYLIVVDDIWSVEAWDRLRLCLPENNNGSRIMVTTRLSSVANNICSSDVYQMNLLDEDKCWRLLCTKVFAGDCCPPELEDIGKKIARNCDGLPLSIAVIGGLLAKSKMTREFWEYVAENISTTLDMEDDERCFKILYLSYSHLPIYLKPCFLYMGAFPEDYEIRVSQLIKLWTAEGFLKTRGEKTLEEVANDNLKDLIERNLIFVKLGCTGNLKVCKIHDLLRDLCLREANKESFFALATRRDIYSIGINRRIAVHQSATRKKYWPQVSQGWMSTSSIRSLLCFKSDIVPSTDFKLLRISSGVDYSRVNISSLNNSRYLDFSDHCNLHKDFPPIDFLWNLQTLILGNMMAAVAPSKIWEMPQLRHLVVSWCCLPNPPPGRVDDIVLKNLQTLSYVDKFRWTDEVLLMIPNVKKLKVMYSEGKDLSHYCLKNLGRLNKLQSLECEFQSHWPSRSDLLQNLEFSPSLKKLTLSACGFHWDDMATKIGQLPNLEKLKLLYCFKGEEWSPVEGQFVRLKYLELNRCDLIRWIADSTHFPCLEHLVLRVMEMLEEIPFGFADIVTLQSIHLKYCNNSMVASAKEILEEQKNLGNEGFRLILSS